MKKKRKASKPDEEILKRKPGRPKGSKDKKPRKRAKPIQRKAPDKKPRKRATPIQRKAPDKKPRKNAAKGKATIDKVKSKASITDSKNITLKDGGINYLSISESPKKYLSTYTHKVRFNVVKESESGREYKKEKWVTIVSERRLTKAEVIKLASNAVYKEEQASYSEEGEYETDFNSFQIDVSYYNPEFSTNLGDDIF